ncbi:alkaline phosphatase family protein [Thermococcus barophilus]|uniref:Sulfatase N-terminal domain-containing protein n=1 Tax=Thermococcus barophilus TaxID=55802 RepID=A0A0S1XF97_THEBA|nr:hypothetical protein [Thermococcus barophilus]ALM76387.1 hypothetical protein TBCH5v1_2496 [Thermococcus barophilus]
MGRYLSTVIKNWKNILWWRNVFLYKVFVPILFRDNNGISIFEETWDSLVILDACRYDVFEEEYKKRKMKGKLECRISKGTETTSFLLENFTNENYKDIVYITANPFVDLLLHDKFYKIISVWKDGWCNEWQTVLPKTVYEYTIYAINRYPNKRFIVHFIQPHYPYIGYNFTDGSFEELRRATLDGALPKIKRKYRDSFFSIFSMDIYAMVDTELQFRAYKQNLKLVLSYVEKLVDILPGRTVVTSDHGEAFGEKLHPLIPIKVYGHPPKIRIPALIKVPWLVVEPEEKKPSKDLEKELRRIRQKFEQKQKQEDEKLKKAIKNLKLKGKI